MTLPRRLYHYCCFHSVDFIAADRGTLRPPGEEHTKFRDQLLKDVPEAEGWEQPLLIWLSDIDVSTWQDVEALGLTSPYAKCNRVEYRYRVPRLGNIEAWPDWVERTGHHKAHLLAEAPGAQPERWWVSEVPLAGAQLDGRYHMTVVGRPQGT